jgi:thioredoxin-related protein
MKSLLYLLLISILSGCFGKKPTLDTGHEGKLIPSIDLLLLDSTTHVNIQTAQSNKPIVLFYFSPHCPYCRALTTNIIAQNKKLQGIQFYMLSSYPLQEINKYNTTFKLKEHNNITIGQDVQRYFENYYKAPGYPCIAIYGKDKKLKQVLMGSISPDIIKDLAFEE